MPASFVLFETTALTGASPSEYPVRIGTVGYSHPSAPGYFEPDIKDSAGVVITREIYPSRLAFGFGDARENVAVVTALNSSGKYDALADFGWGQSGQIKIGSSGDAYGDLQTVFAGRVAGVVAGKNLIEFAWRARGDALDDPASQGVFAGNNNFSPTDHLEGTDTDIGGQRKPRAGGVLYNIEPVLVNGPKRVFAWNYDKDGARAPTHSLDDFRLSGSSGFIVDADYPNAAALMAATPTTGHIVTCLAESLLMVGGSVPLSGGVRIDVTIEATAAERYASALAKARIEESGLSCDSASFAALAAAMPYEAGFYVRDESFRTVADALLGSVLAWANLGRTGTVKAGILPDLSAATAAATLRRFEIGSAAKANDIAIMDIEPEVIADAELGAPAKEVRVRFYKNHAPLNRDSIASGVADSVAAALSQEWRSTDAVIDLSVAAQFANAAVVTHDTLLATAAGAEAVRDALAVAIGQLRKRFRIKARLSPALAAAFSVGDAIEIYYPRFGFEAGKKAFVTRESINASLRIAEFGVWL